MIHKLKTWPDYYHDVISGKKLFEVRYNDRNFQVGDTLRLLEWSPADEDYTGEQMDFDVTYILEGGAFGIEDGYVVMSIIEIK